MWLGRLGRLFWNPQQRRLRLVWRLVALVILLMVCAALLGLAWNALRLGRWVPDWAPFFAANAVSALALLAATLLAAVLIDRRPWADLGFHISPAWWADLGFGLGLGALLMLVIFAAEWAMGWITIVDTPGVTDPGELSWRGLVAPLIIFVYVGIYEELLSRGYILHNLAEGLNFRRLGSLRALVLAWFLSSLLFGLAHAGNPNSSWVSTLYLTVGGLFLGFGYVLTGELAISIGLHITWNFFQGVVLGFPVSGIDFSQTTLIATRQGGPSLWTGGSFGPEAGLVGLLAELLGALLILVWVRWRHGRDRLQEYLAEYQPGSSEGLAS